MKRIGEYKIIKKIADSTREVFLVEKDGKQYVMKTLTTSHASKHGDFFLPRDVQDQIETEIDRWERYKDMGILNPIIDIGRDNKKCCTCFIITHYIENTLDKDESIFKDREEEIRERVGALYKQLDEDNLWVDEVTYEELMKPSSWGITVEGKLVLIDYGV